MHIALRGGGHLYDGCPSSYFGYIFVFLLSVQWMPRSKNSYPQYKSYPFCTYVLKMITRKDPAESMVSIVRFWVYFKRARKLFAYI